MTDAAGGPSDADAALVQAALRGSEVAFERLVLRYQTALVRLARSFVRDEALAEDVVQDTWIGLLKGLERFEGRSAFRTWLFQILCNRARSRAVRDSRYVPLDDDGSNPDGEVFDPSGRWRVPPRTWGPTPEQAVLGREIRQTIEVALAGLPPLQRTVVELRDVQECDARDVCNILGITETHQRVLLHRGRAKVRAALAGRLEGR